MTALANSTAGEYLTSFRLEVERALASFFEAARIQGAELTGQHTDLIEQVATLTMRGGKRFRALLIEAAYLAVAGPTEPPAFVTVPQAAALELLQTYLLIHDDWMDDDDMRRGGLSVHAALRQKYDRHLADSLAILAGDLASNYARELLCKGTSEEIARRLDDRFRQIEVEVLFGQELDLRASKHVDRMHRLKTTSYTVAGPLDLGAILADASAATREQLASFALPLGQAFQKRDDLLGVIGDPKDMGKPGSDIPHGKRTAVLLLAEQTLTGAARTRFKRAFGQQDTSIETLAIVIEDLKENGIIAQVESEIAEAHTAALGALAQGDLHPFGVELLGLLAERLVKRRV